jgi:hypothetical protein
LKKCGGLCPAAASATFDKVLDDTVAVEGRDRGLSRDLGGMAFGVSDRRGCRGFADVGTKQTFNLIA